MIAHRLLVCGGRKFGNEKALCQLLDELHKVPGIDVVITGDATGADACAREWAKKNQVRLEVHYALWDKHKKSAGPIRNQEMLAEGRPTLAVVAPGGNGTQDMVSRLKKAGVRIWYV